MGISAQGTRTEKMQQHLGLDDLSAGVLDALCEGARRVHLHPQLRLGLHAAAECLSARRTGPTRVFNFI